MLPPCIIALTTPTCFEGHTTRDEAVLGREKQWQAQNIFTIPILNNDSLQFIFPTLSCSGTWNEISRIWAYSRPSKLPQDHGQVGVADYRKYAGPSSCGKSSQMSSGYFKLAQPATVDDGRVFAFMVVAWQPCEHRMATKYQRASMAQTRLSNN